MKFPENRLARQLSSRLVLPVLVTFALSLLLTACSGANAGTPSSSAGATTAPTGTANLSPTPATINFGTVQLNSKAVTTVVTLTNVGKSAETIESATIAPTSIFSIQDWTEPVTLKAGQAVQLRTVFAPTSAGNYSGTLILVTLRQTPVPLSKPVVIDGPTLPSSQPRAQVHIPVIGTAASTETSPPPTVSVSVSPSSLVLQSGQSMQFKATVTGTTNPAVVWTAALGSISTSGVYTAPTVATQKVDSVSAVSVADSTKYDTVSPVILVAGAAYNLEQQQPNTPVIFSSNPASIFSKRLPANVMSHLWGGSTSAGHPFALCITNDCGGSTDDSIWGQMTWASYGNMGGGIPWYYATESDPWYVVNGCGYCQSGWTVKFHAPNNAWWQGTNDTGQGGDNNFGVWDQTSNIAVQLYHGTSQVYTKTTIGACPGGGHAGTQDDPCPITGANGASASDFYQGQDWGSTWNGLPNTMSSLGAGPGAAYLRVNELLAGVIPHAILAGTQCINAPSGKPSVVFPGTATGPNACSSNYQSAYRPYEGMLYFADYTDAQLDCMDPAKPVCQYSDGTDIPKVADYKAMFLTQLAHYGQYIAETGGTPGNAATLSPYNLEDVGTAWSYSGNELGSPIWNYWQSKGIACGPRSGQNPSQMSCTVAVYQGIPPLPGPGTSDQSGRSCSSSQGCDLSGHIQVADPCVARALAGQTAAQGACP